MTRWFVSLSPDGLLSKPRLYRRPNSPHVKSAFHLATRNHDGRLIPTQVLIVSAASFNGKEGFFSFSIANEGEGLVGVLLNVRTLPQMYPDVSFEKPIFLKPKTNVAFKAVLPERPIFEPTTVVIYGEDGKAAALQTAGFYVPETGKTMIPVEQLWTSGR